MSIAEDIYTDKLIGIPTDNSCYKITTPHKRKTLFNSCHAYLASGLHHLEFIETKQVFGNLNFPGSPGRSRSDWEAAASHLAVVQYEHRITKPTFEMSGNSALDGNPLNLLDGLILVDNLLRLVCQKLKHP